MGVEQKRGEQDENETVTLYKYPAVFCLPLFCLSELTKILSWASVYLFAKDFEKNVEQ